MALPRFRSASLIAFLLLCALRSEPASALSENPPNGLGVMTAGSILVFPLFDNSQQARTIVSITNTNEDASVCDNDFRRGDVLVHFTYVSEANCDRFDISEALTPGDTFATRTDEHNTQFTRGWLWVEAQDPDTGRPIDFDYLVGSAYLGHEKPNLKWCYGAYAFRSFREESNAPFGVDGCGHAFIDPNGVAADFNGTEYAFFPEYLRIDHFLGEGQPPELGTASVDSSLVLMTTAPAGTQFTASIFNNNETKFSRTFTFNCWKAESLSIFIGGVGEGLLRNGYDPRELSGLPYGHLKIRADSGGVLGLFVEKVVRQDGKLLQAFGRPLQFASIRSTSISR